MTQSTHRNNNNETSTKTSHKEKTTHIDQKEQHTASAHHSQAEKKGQKEQAQESGQKVLRESPMMAHLLDALEQGTDIGHYGRLTFVMVARHFLPDDEIIQLLSHQPDHNATDSRALLQQVKAHDYNPPKRERILEWQSKQDFPICPTPDDPDSCNVYQELNFPSHIYDNISEYYEEKAEQEQ